MFHCSTASIVKIDSSSDGRVIRASASGAVDLGLIRIPSRGKPMILKLVFTVSLLDAQALKGMVWRTSWQVYLLCRWERHLTGFPRLVVVDRWRTTCKRARYRADVAFSCKEDKYATKYNVSDSNPLMQCFINRPVTSVIKHFVIGAGGLRFDSRIHIIGHSAANGSPQLRRFCVAQALNRGDGPRHSYTLQRNTANIRKIQFDILHKHLSLFAANLRTHVDLSFVGLKLSLN